jgi:hypothetical protein
VCASIKPSIYTLAKTGNWKKGKKEDNQLQRYNALTIFFSGNNYSKYGGEGDP